MSLSQTSVHLGEDLALCSLLRADQADHEALLDAKTEDTLNVGADHLEMHEANEAVLEQVCAHLVDVLSLVLILLFQGDKLATLRLPSRPVVNEGLRNDADLAACLDHIVQLWFVDNGMVHLVVLTILDSSHSQSRHNCERHALLLARNQSSLTLFFQVRLSLKEELVVIISGHNLLVFGVNCSKSYFVVLKLHELILPTLKFFHLLLVHVLFLDHTALLFLATCSLRFLIEFL